MSIIKKAFELTNKNIMLICSLIILSIISSVYINATQAIGMGKNSHFLILYILIFVTFSAGFFNQIKSYIIKSDKKFKFLAGVGDYFLPMLGIAILSLILYTAGAILSCIIASKLAGGADVMMAALNRVVQFSHSSYSTQNIDLSTIKQVIMLLSILWLVWGILSFILLYWVPVLYFENQKNIFKSLAYGVKFLFQTFGKSLLIFVSFVFAIAVVSFSLVFASVYPILEAVLSVLSYYLTVMFLFSVFLFYDNKKHSENNESKEIVL